MLRSVRRGLLKDLANTPTQMVCGWRLYGPDLRRLTELADRTIELDLLTRVCTVGTDHLDPPLTIAHDIADWLDERFDRDGVPQGTISRATVTLKPRTQPAGLRVECITKIETASRTYESRDIARWHNEDIKDF